MDENSVRYATAGYAERKEVRDDMEQTTLSNMKERVPNANESP